MQVPSRRSIAPLMLAVFVFAIGSPVAHAQRTPPSEWKWVDENIAKGCQHATLFSKSMQRDIGYSIYLPPSYEKSAKRRYPVVYYLHGASGSESSSREFAWAVQQGIADEVIEDTIYVFPNGGHYSGYRDWKDENVKAETWIIRELIPHIDATYRTHSTREKRALCGWSMGGGGSLRFLTKYPDMFCAAATLGAALNMRGSDPEDSATFHAKKNADKLRGRTGIWMAVGEDDRLKAGNESLSATLKNLKIDHSLTIHPETGHNLGQMSAKFHRDIVLMLNRHLTGKGKKDVDQKLKGDDRVERDSPDDAILVANGKRDIRVHDPSSIVRCGDDYWMFSTGTGVKSWRSKDLQEWRSGPRVFPTMPDWVRDVVPTQRGHFWAPDIIRLNDRYLLYYSVSSFGSNTSAIALASTPTLNPDDDAFEWTDHGIVTRSSKSDNYNAIDPAVIMTDDGKLWMSFGSFWSGLKLLQLDPTTGKRIDGDDTLHSIAQYKAIEAPHIFHNGGFYYLFVNWDRCCRGVDSTYNIRVGRSESITGPYIDRDGVDLGKGGGTMFLETDGPFIGPGHANILREGDDYWFSCHFYDGTQRGRSKFAIRPLAWEKDGWPKLPEQP